MQKYNLKQPFTDFHKVILKKYVKGWYLLAKNAIKKDIPKLILSYENIVQNPVKYAEKMARFILGDAISEIDLQERLLCLKQSSNGEFKRRKRPSDPYYPLLKSVINKYIQLFVNDLKNAGIQDIPDYRRQK